MRRHVISGRSLLALLAGPLVYVWLTARQTWLQAMNGAIFVLVAGLVFWGKTTNFTNIVSVLRGGGDTRFENSFEPVVRGWNAHGNADKVVAGQS